MTRRSTRPLRTAVLLVLALTVVGALAYQAQQRLYATPPTLDLRPPGSVDPDAPGVPRASTVRTASGGGSGGGSGGAGVPVVDEGWLESTSEASGVPLVALRAYARAELRSPSSCRLGWTTLAGIGWIESQHGLIGGRTLLDDGSSSTRILGPALDGTGDFMAIPATAQSRRWHGDREWDHAFGPMQFISGTWVAWSSDGDGDGVEDPNDLDDAAYAAARYLCAGERDLAGVRDWTAAVLSYNNSRSYLDAVHTAATSYAERTA